ncbi:MAG: hypothetical protein V3S11_02950, partial [Elusimicrobiota bacterium]
IANDPEPDPLSINPKLPVGVKDIIHKVLSKNPANRYQKASEMAVALRALVESMKHPSAEPEAAAEAAAEPTPSLPEAGIVPSSISGEGAQAAEENRPEPSVGPPESEPEPTPLQESSAPTPDTSDRSGAAPVPSRSIGTGAEGAVSAAGRGESSISGEGAQASEENVPDPALGTASDLIAKPTPPAAAQSDAGPIPEAVTEPVPKTAGEELTANQIVDGLAGETAEPAAETTPAPAPEELGIQLSSPPEASEENVPEETAEPASEPILVAAEIKPPGVAGKEEIPAAAGVEAPGAGGKAEIPLAAGIEPTQESGFTPGQIAESIPDPAGGEAKVDPGSIMPHVAPDSLPPEKLLPPDMTGPDIQIQLPPDPDEKK